ncbi:MAG TPA: hypothetical protein VGO48_17630 [Conexibacter sp.]|jgi:hypothetical protein|nr:hypothetical protein [Conexibacter sp.]
MSDATRSLAIKLVGITVALVLSATVWSAGTWSAFDRTASSPGNAVATGTVSLADNDGDAPLLLLTGARNGSSVTSCTKLTYGGTVPSDVRIYGTVGGGLATYLTLTITRGTIAGTPAAKSCTGFVADSTDYLSRGAGVIYSGTLAAFPTSAAGTLVDPTSSAPEQWDNGEAHAYKLTVTMNSASGVGLSATADFTWLAAST